MPELNDLKLYAQGGQAQIYEYGSDKVLRVLRSPKDEALLQYEITITKALGHSGVLVPEVFESMLVDGRPAVVVQRINGISMLDYIKRHPLQLRKQAGVLASLHIAVSQNAVPGLKSGRERAHFLTERAHELSPNTKAFVHGLIDVLPDGEALCHGDFHPGNILKSAGGDYIIDWFGAYHGDILSDIAHTYLILKNVPRFPGVSAAAHRVMKITGGMIAREYLKTIRKLLPFETAQFSRWLVVKAAERSFYGMPAEKPLLMAFIEKCRQNDAAPAMWVRWI